MSRSKVDLCGSEKNANSSVGDVHYLEDGVRCSRSDICSILGEACSLRSDVCPKLRDEATVVYIYSSVGDSRHSVSNVLSSGDESCIWWDIP